MTMIFTHIWSTIISIITSCLQILRPLLPKNFGKKIENRSLTQSTLDEIYNQVSKHPLANRCIFFCSSAGEYDQAKPLMNSVKKLGILPVIIFFSESGILFAEKRKEENPYFLYPFDTIRNNKKIFNLIQPCMSFVVRQEVWPSFIYMSKSTCPTYLICISKSESAESKSNLFIKRLLYKNFNHLFTVSKADKTHLIKDLAIASNKITVAGDTKYDNVTQRAELKKSAITNLKSEFSKEFGDKKRIIIGSSWPADLKISCSNLKSFLTSGNITFIVAPHKISEESLCETENILENFELTYVRYSKRQETEDLDKIDIVILDTMGQLSEFYGICHLAVVGGANHYQVHNVLEPAAYGLPITFGPRHKNSHEAMDLVRKGLVTPTKTSSQFSTWLNQNISLNENEKNKMLSYVTSLTGASNIILEKTNDR